VSDGAVEVIQLVLGNVKRYVESFKESRVVHLFAGLRAGEIRES